MILAILFAILGYRAAGKSGRPKILWAVILAIAFLAVQVAVFAVGVFGVRSLGWDPTVFTKYEWPLNLGGWLLGVLVCSAILFFLGKSADPGSLVEETPAPDEPVDA
ncbi:MAG: hypothetical protein HKN33_02445 [Pyrinomonadaceae bacterium]|nr:hypothetical protein [Pyrinomonadaceae bacterium]